MSTIAVNAITDASGGTTASINGYTPTASNMAGKNRIINGAMMIDQRNAGGSVTPTGNIYTLDRWYAVTPTLSSKFSVQQNAGSVTPPTGFSNYLGLTSLAATTISSADRSSIKQVIEGYNIADLGFGSANAKTFTLSFWVRSSLTGTFGGAFVNNDGNRSYPFTYTISSANTWEQKAITVVGDTTGTWYTNNSGGLQVYFNVGTGSNYESSAGSWQSGDFRKPTGAIDILATNGATWYITGVQLEVGSAATEFEHRLYGQELALCQRYFLKAIDNGLDCQMIATRDSATNAWINIATPVSMRSTPTLGVPSGYGRIVTYTTAFSLAIPSISSMGLAYAGQNQYNIYFGIASTAGTYVFTSYDTIGTTTPLTLSAEL